jgi:TusA-related sulfurtransferase
LAILTLQLRLQAHEDVEIIATASGTVRGFQAFAKQTGNELVEQSNAGPEYVSVLRRR